MKTLPDSPDMGHLRQQAKDVLVQLRSTRPDARRASAEHEIPGLLAVPPSRSRFERTLDVLSP